MSDTAPVEGPPAAKAAAGGEDYTALSKAWIARAFVWVSGIFMGSFAIRLAIEVWYPLPGTWVVEIFKTQYAATVAVPLAMVEAFLLVVLLRQYAGEMEFEVLGFKLRGASGPFVLWVLGFLALVFAVWLLWNADDPSKALTLPSIGGKEAP